MRLDKNISYRRNAVFLFFTLFFVLIGARLFFLQLWKHSYFIEFAQKQHHIWLEVPARRGNIYSTNLDILTNNLVLDSVWACPYEIRDKNELTEILTSILDMSKESLKDKLSLNKSFVWLARKIEPEKSQKIKSLKLKGIYLTKEYKRSYPHGYLLSHLLGFVGLDNEGLEGLEFYYDKYLKGEPGCRLLLRDARQNQLDLGEYNIPAKDGYDLILTIDEVVQYIVERELDKLVEKYRPLSAIVIVMEPHTGQILAMANRPTYDLNHYSCSNKEFQRNRAISDIFEPGSVFKIVTLCAALEEKKFKENDKIFCEKGSYRVASHILNDHQPHGWLTLQEVIEQSSNIGTVKIAQKINREVIYRYIRLFGFGSKLGIDLPGEVGGIVKEPKKWSSISIAAIPIGHEVGVTALQLVSAMSVIANGGKLMKPYVVKEIRDKYGNLIKSKTPLFIRRVISEETAQRARSILRGVVERGTAKLAESKEFAFAGKTGTAQKINPDGTYSHSRYVASFVGFAPFDNPQISIAVIVDEPKGSYYGGVVAAPTFKNIAEDVLRYLNLKIIKKDETNISSQSAG